MDRFFIKHGRQPWRLGRSGFTLIEILLSLAIVSVILIFLLNSFQFVKNEDKVDETRLRMDQITAKLRAYYRGQQSLPAPAATPQDSVPVDPQHLDLPQKYRLDSQGQFFRYFVATKNDASGNVITDIVGFEVDGRRAAGVLISLGPDQTPQYTFENNATPPTYQSGTGDDILVPVTVNQEAMEIVMEELDVLQKRVAAYDRIFAGVDNDSDLSNEEESQYKPTNAPDPNNRSDYGDVDYEPRPDGQPWDAYDRPDDEDPYRLVDEDGCKGAETNGSPECPITGARQFSNDPNCGTATIDDCPSALNDLIILYGLGQSYGTDPWGNQYRWGSLENANNDTNDRRYHVFFSTGPDGEIYNPSNTEMIDDDITPY